MKKIPQDIFGDIAILKFKKTTPWLIKKIKAKKFLKENKNLTTILEKKSGFSGTLRTMETKHLTGIKTKIATYKENNCIFKFSVDESYFSPRLSNERKIIAEEVAQILNSKLTKKTTQVGGKKFSSKISGDPCTKIKSASINNKSKQIKILVMFAGIAPYPIVIAKKLKEQKKDFIIYSNELNKKANEDALLNIKLNKLENYIKLIPGDAKKIPSYIANFNKSTPVRVGGKTSKASWEKENKIPEKFDIILMPRPNLEDTFLKTALKLSKKGTVIFYHGFGTKEEVLNEIERDTRYFDLINKQTKFANLKGGNKKIKDRSGKSKLQSIIKNLEIRKAGDIGAYKFRWNVRFEIR